MSYETAHDLPSFKEMDIQNGLVASIRWYDAVMGVADKELADKTFDSLLKYCCLDTLAMVKIYDYLELLSSTDITTAEEKILA